MPWWDVCDPVDVPSTAHPAPPKRQSSDNTSVWQTGGKKTQQILCRLLAFLKKQGLSPSCLLDLPASPSMRSPGGTRGTWEQNLEKGGIKGRLRDPGWGENKLGVTGNLYPKSSPKAGCSHTKITHQRAKCWRRVMRIQVGMEQKEQDCLPLLPQVCARLTWHTWHWCSQQEHTKQKGTTAPRAEHSQPLPVV